MSDTNMTPQFVPGFAILDVKNGRDALERHVGAGKKVMITVTVEIDTVHSGDDGTSQEFSGQVVSWSHWQTHQAPKE